MRWLGFALLVLGLVPACDRHTLTARSDGGADALPDRGADLPAADEAPRVLGDAKPDGTPDLAQPDAAANLRDAGADRAGRTRRRPRSRRPTVWREWWRAAPLPRSPRGAC